jgi:TrmH family RNA methyltransferase
LIAAKPQSSLESIDASLSNAANLPIVLFLEEINNPSNLGAVIRTAEAAGVVGVIMSENSADAFSPKALRAAMGSSLRLPIWENISVEDVLRWSVEQTLTVTAADAAGTANYTEIDWKKPRLLILGSEAHGISDAARKGTKEMIRIPMAPSVESLNLAVSCGVILFEARRQYFG